MRSRRVVVLMCGLGVLVCGSGLAQPTSEPSPHRTTGVVAVPAEVGAGHAAFEDEQWTAAVEKYQAALGAGYSDSLVHFRLGYALHMLKRYEEALKHHLRASHIGLRALRVDALYNAACANALLGRKDEAMRCLEAARDAGFRDAAQAARDTDLDTLRGGAGFEAFVKSIGEASPPRLGELLDGLAGAWKDAGAADEQMPAVRLRFERFGEKGVQALERTNAMHTQQVDARGLEWVGALVPDAATRTWTWVSGDGLGSTMMLRGGPAEGAGTFVFAGRQHGAAGAGPHFRVRLKLEGAARLRVVTEVSEDGEKWRVLDERGMEREEKGGETSPPRR